MKLFVVLTVLCFTGVQCSDSRTKRDVSELLYKTQNLFSKPNYNQGYDYPKPGISQGPIWRDPEPGLSQGPNWREPEPTYIETRPIYREPEPTWIQQRPVEPSYILRPVYQQPSINTRPVYRPQQGGDTHEKLFWPLLNKIGVPLGSSGTNSVGYPGTSNGNYFPSSPGILQNKLAWLGNLFPGLSTFSSGYPTNSYNYQRMSQPAPRPVIFNTGNTGVYQTPSVQGPSVYPIYQPGVNTIGDSVTVEAADPSDGYNYPRPSEQLPPLDLPNSVQFRAESKNGEDDRK